MARAKQQELTLEEKLKQALVPEDEQPYKVPGNWVWTSFSYCLESIESGKRPKGGVSNIKNGIPSLGGEHLSSNGGFNFENIRYVPEDFARKMTKGVIEKNDIHLIA